MDVSHHYFFLPYAVVMLAPLRYADVVVQGVLRSDYFEGDNGKCMSASTQMTRVRSVVVIISRNDET